MPKISQTHTHTFADGTSVTKSCEMTFSTYDKPTLSHEKESIFIHPETGERFTFRFVLNKNSKNGHHTFTDDDPAYDSDDVSRYKSYWIGKSEAHGAHPQVSGCGRDERLRCTLPVFVSCMSLMHTSYRLRAEDHSFITLGFWIHEGRACIHQIIVYSRINELWLSPGKVLSTPLPKPESHNLTADSAIIGLFKHTSSQIKSDGCMLPCRPDGQSRSWFDVRNRHSLPQ